MSGITIKELAAMLNLSKSTVSRAFTGYGDINDKTKERILKAAEEHQYEPNYHASNLRRNKAERVYNSYSSKET